MPYATQTAYDRRPAIVFHQGRSLHVDRIARQQEFRRQPFGEDDFNKPGMMAIAYITKTVELTTDEMDDLLLGLAEEHEFLSGEGGHVGSGHLADGLLCVECKAPGHTALLIDPEGSSSVFYIAELR